MRTFLSYGPIDRDLNYYADRQELIDGACQQLLGDDPNKGGHYITLWAPRQTGKTWIMQEALLKLQKDNKFDVVFLSLQNLSSVTDVNHIAQIISRKIIKQLNLGKSITIDSLDNFDLLFEREVLTKPLILILDEFDSLPESAITKLVAIFRHIYNTRKVQVGIPTAEKEYLLHSLALIGVRAVVGVENMRGSPFNIQRSVHIPNLTHDEVNYIFNWYQQETGQTIKPEVVEQIWYEFQGQPGLTCWFGELLTKTYNQATDEAITMQHFEKAYIAAINLLPNNNILNIISKAKQEDCKDYVLELFRTKSKINFTYDDSIINFLYMNGIVAIEEASWNENYVKFACPYIQKRLFNYFARELYSKIEGFSDPFEDLSDTITENSLNISRLLQRYEQYLQDNQELILKDAPRRRKDLRIYEAIFHFNIYLYLTNFLRSYKAVVQPEFPTGNGQIDILIRHAGQVFGLELKSFADKPSYKEALIQAAKYGQKLGVTRIWLVLFIEKVDDDNRKKYETDYMDSETGVMVHPRFVQINTMV
jgi:hypothetical protein